jgi:hypothetical protein
VEGKFTDVILRLKLSRQEEGGGGSDDERPAKHARRSSRRREDERTARRVVAEVPCVGAVLSARSPYFASCLQGEWREAKTRTVDITLEDERAAADFKLLLKLTYGPTYTRGDDGVLLDKATRLRLAVLADAYEMTDCVNECLLSLADGISLEEATTCLDCVPYELRHQPAVKALKDKLISVVAQGIEAHSGPVLGGLGAAPVHQALVANAVDELAAWLGPVHSFFTEGPRTLSRLQGNVNTPFPSLLPLKPAITDLGANTLEALLKSPALQCESENEPYYLLLAWLQQSAHAPPMMQQVNLFTRLAQHIRFQHMDAHYIANVLTCCRMLGTASTGLLAAAVHAALGHRELDGPTLQQGGIAKKLGARLPGARKASPVWSIRTTIALTDCLRLVGAGDFVQGTVGLVAGYPLRMYVSRGEADAVSLGFAILLPSWEEARLNYLDMPWRGLTFAMSVKAGAFAWEYRGCACPLWLAFPKTYTELVGDGSPYFNGGKMVVTATFRVLKKEGTR